MKTQEQLIEKCEQVGNLICELPWENEKFYANYLAQTYYYVSHSIRLLGLAIARLESDIVRKRFVTHISEEHGHEKLCVNDLKFLGLTPGDFKEQSLTKAFYQTQYFKTDRNPISLLGYILALEILAAKVLPRVNIRLKELYPRSISFVKVHAEEDQDHIESAFKQLEMLNEADTAAVLENFDTTIDILVSLFNQLSDESVTRETDIVTKYPHASL